MAHETHHSLEKDGYRAQLARYAGGRVLLRSRQGTYMTASLAVCPGALRDKIHELKCSGVHGGAMVFGRLLVGWMESHPEQMRGVDHVVGNPTHAGRQPLQHVEAIMDAAYTEDITRSFPLSPPGARRLVKGSDTPRSANRSLDDKRAAAAAHAAALTWTGDTGDRATILLLDDVFTSGSQRRIGQQTCGHLLVHRIRPPLHPALPPALADGYTGTARRTARRVRSAPVPYGDRETELSAGFLTQ
ncbi:hypothetical protein [Streptomyces griseicoloratus]|uniref:hypothetical protein n=1 Tax=Streptomyces griseicoloratus TaxID=2752516 RepID=UPI001CB756AB|nr:hypothetical protein [Streptomyces griseicoloratus]